MESFLKDSGIALEFSTIFLLRIFFLLRGRAITVGLSLPPLEERRVCVVTDVGQANGIRHLGPE